MAGSPFFARLRRDALAVVRDLPAGGVVTFADIGRHLDAAPRHIAYFLAGLTPEERAALPAHRVLAASGLPASNEQRELLIAEGIGFDAKGAATGPWTDLLAVPGMLPPQPRPADAPASGRPRRGASRRP